MASAVQLVLNRDANGNTFKQKYFNDGSDNFSPIVYKSGTGEASVGYAQVTVNSTAQSLTQLLTAANQLSNTIPSSASCVAVLPEDNFVRWRDDSVNPTTNTGMIIFATNTFVYDGSLSSFKVISDRDSVVSLLFKK